MVVVLGLRGLRRFGLGDLLSHAAVGLPDGSAAWPWWLLGGPTAAFTALYLVGLAEAGQEKPFA